jgi:hypothetical protein
MASYIERRKFCWAGRRFRGRGAVTAPAMPVSDISVPRLPTIRRTRWSRGVLATANSAFSNFEPAMSGKWLELLKEIAPDVTRVLVVFDRANRSSAEFYRMIEGLAPPLNLQHHSAAVANAGDIEHAIDSFAQHRAGGLIVVGGTVAAANREAIVGLASRHRLLAIYSFGYYARIGGLISYGVDGVDLWRRAATYVDRILRGATPADLPVQAPTKFELVINLKTAKALGLTVPPTLLATADEVIECRCSAAWPLRRVRKVKRELTGIRSAGQIIIASSPTAAIPTIRNANAAAS